MALAGLDLLPLVSNVVPMTIVVNGEAMTLNSGNSLQNLLEELALTEKRIAVEINGEIVPRSAWPAHALYDGDRIEVVHAIGGG